MSSTQPISAVPNDIPPLGRPADAAPLPAKADPLSRQRALVALGRRAVAPPDLAILMQDGAMLLAEMLETEYSLVGQLSPDSRTLTLRLTRLGAPGVAPQFWIQKVRADEKQSLAGCALQSGRSITVRDLAAETAFQDALLTKHGLRSALVAPLRMQDQSYGALGVCTPHARAFGDEENLFAETVTHLVSTAMARSAAEQALVAERRLSAGLFQSVDAMVLLLDREGCVVRLNAACERNTGFSLQDIRGRPLVSALVFPSDASAFIRSFQAVTKGTEQLQIECQLLTKHAQRRHVAWTLAAMPDAEGGVGHVLATGIDITRQRELERQVAKPVQSVVSGDCGSPINAERRRRPRRSYPYAQRVGWIIDGETPGQDAFFAVNCYDIGPGGFSFLLPTPPKADLLVVELGVPPQVTYLTAQVVHVHRMQHEGQPLFRLGCTYTGRVSYA